MRILFDQGTPQPHGIRLLSSRCRKRFHITMGRRKRNSSHSGPIFIHEIRRVRLAVEQPDER